jgi:hypothetical protein
LVLGIAATASGAGSPDRHGDVLIPVPEEEEAVRSALLSLADLGAGWRVPAPVPGAPNTWSGSSIREAAPALEAVIDPGIEDPETRCGIARLIGLPDGVKRAWAWNTWMADDELRAYVVSGAAVFPSEENARARYDAYVSAIQRCEDDLSLGTSTGAPLEQTQTRELVDLPRDAFGQTTRIGWSLSDDFAYEQTDVVFRHGRLLAAISVTRFDSAQLDVSVLAGIISERVEQAAARLAPAQRPIPLYEANGRAEELATAALATSDEFPASWRFEPTPVVVTDADSTTIVSVGGRMFITSDSTACRADMLLPESGMEARAGTNLMEVGWDHYVWQHVAVYENEQTAREVLERVIAGMQTCTEENDAQRPPDLNMEWTPIQLSGLAHADDRVSAGVERWLIGFREPPDRDHAWTWLSVAIRRGRMVSTLSFTAPGKDEAAARYAAELAIGKLEEVAKELD